MHKHVPRLPLPFQASGAASAGNAFAIELMEAAHGGDANTPPARHIMSLSVDWRTVLPPSGADPPGAGALIVVCVPTMHVERVLAATIC